MARTRTAARILVLVIATATAVACSRAPRHQDEFDYLALLNASRAEAGLPFLLIEPDLVGYARLHAAVMADRGRIFHSRRVEALARSGGWGRLAENVGVGGSPTSVHDAFMRSPRHRAHILGDYTHVAIGTTRTGDGRLYLTAIFTTRVDRTILFARRLELPGATGRS